MTNVRVRGKMSSASDNAGNRALAGDRALGEVGGVFQTIPQG